MFIPTENMKKLYPKVILFDVESFHSGHPPRSGGGRPQSTYSTVKDGVHLSDSHQFINIPTTFLDFFPQHCLEKSRTLASFKIISRYLSSDWTNCALWKCIYWFRQLRLTSLRVTLERQFKLELRKVIHLLLVQFLEAVGIFQVPTSAHLNLAK